MNKLKEFLYRSYINFHSPTPKIWRKIGNSIAGIGASITSIALYQNNHLMLTIAAICTIVGPFLCNFFTEDNQNNP